MSDHRMKVTAYVLAFSVYAAAGYWLHINNVFIIGDALSRVSAAQSVLFSRDPHLAAIGFIFTPLTAMLQMPPSCSARCGRTSPNAPSPVH